MRQRTVVAAVVVLIAVVANGPANSQQDVIVAPVNVDKVDGFDASAAPAPGTLLPLDADGRFPLAALPACAAGQILKQGPDGWACDADGGGTAYAAGPGLALDGGMFSVRFGGTGLGEGTVDRAARADHNHHWAYYQKHEMDTAAGEVNREDNPVHWLKLKGVPDGFADGVDDGGGPATNVICTGCVHNVDLGDGSVTSENIGLNAVGSFQIADGAVGTSEIALSGVTSSDIATGAVGTSEIADGAVRNAEIASNAVDSSKISDEPAIKAGGTSANSSIAEDSNVAIASVTVTFPSSGFAMITSQASLAGIGGQAQGIARLREGSTQLDLWEVYAPDDTLYAYEAAMSRATVRTVSAGTRTYTLDMEARYDDMRAGRAQVIVAFFPSSL